MLFSNFFFPSQTDMTAFYLGRFGRLQWESLSQADTVTSKAEKEPDVD